MHAAHGGSNLEARKREQHSAHGRAQIVSGDCVAVSWALVKLLRLVEAGDASGADAVQQARAGGLGGGRGRGACVGSAES